MTADNDGLDADALMVGNIHRVFNERDPQRRLNALADLWTEEPLMFEADEVFKGRQAISDNVGALLARLPAGTLFAPTGSAIRNHDAALLHWAAGTGGAPAVTGNDLAFFRDGKIDRLYVFLEPRK